MGLGRTPFLHVIKTVVGGRLRFEMGDLIAQFVATEMMNVDPSVKVDIGICQPVRHSVNQETAGGDTISSLVPSIRPLLTWNHDLLLGIAPQEDTTVTVIT
jgi:hypothetical protein